MKFTSHKGFPFIIYISLLVILLLFTISTNFNLAGYQYHLDEENMLTIEKGFFKKEVYELPVTADEAIELMIPIIKAVRR